MAETPSLPSASPFRRNARPIRLVIPSPVRQARPTDGDSPPGSPADSSSVRELLNDFDDGGYSEALSAERLVKLAVLGKGSTSTVWEAVDVDTLRIVAVKEMMVYDSKQRAVLEHELRVLHSQLQPLLKRRWNNRIEGAGAANDGQGTGAREEEMDKKACGEGGGASSVFCPYMPGYFGSFSTEDDVGYTRASIILEYMSGGDLGQWMDDRAERCSARGSLPQPPSEAWLARVCRDILEALRHLHARHCIHRDVKPANVLLGPNGAKLADFGSTVSDEEVAGQHRMHGTIRFMSPERLSARKCEASSDLWSAGLTLAAAALGENPLPHCATEFEALEHAEAAYERVRAHRVAPQLSATLMEFLEMVLVAEPDERPTVEQMLGHPFLRAANGLQVNVCAGSQGWDGGDVNRVAPDVSSAADGECDGVDCEGSGDEGETATTTSRKSSGSSTTTTTSTNNSTISRPRENWATACRCCGRCIREAQRRRRRRVSSPEGIVRDIVAARRARRRLGGGELPGAGFNTPPMRELDVTDLARELGVSVNDVRSMLSMTTAKLNDEVDSSPRGKTSPPDFESAPSLTSRASSSNSTRSGASEDASASRMPARLNAPRPMGAKDQAAVAAAVSSSAAPSRAWFGSLHRVLGEWNRGRSSGGSAAKVGSNESQAVMSEDVTGLGARVILGVGQEVGGMPQGNGAWWKTWGQRRRARSPVTSSDKFLKTELPSPRRDTSASSYYECVTRPPSGQNELVVLAGMAANGTDTARRRNRGLLFPGAGNTGKCGGPGPAWTSPGVIRSPPALPEARPAALVNNLGGTATQVVFGSGGREGLRARATRARRGFRGGDRGGLGGIGMAVDEAKSGDSVAGQQQCAALA